MAHVSPNAFDILLAKSPKSTSPDVSTSTRFPICRGLNRAKSRMLVRVCSGDLAASKCPNVPFSLTEAQCGHFG
jgi:hypothetical protein